MASRALTSLQVSIRGRTWRIDTAHAHDLSIPLAFDAPQPNFFGAPNASGRALKAGNFVGDVHAGGSCNCFTYTLTPHCNGTHTECIGHVTRERIGVRDIALTPFVLARLVTVTPVPIEQTPDSTQPTPHTGDVMITQDALEAASRHDGLEDCEALVVRTLPNPPAKRHRSYGAELAPPYFSAQAMQWIVARGLQHLIVDLPSVDRASDAGRLTTHRIFWGLPPYSSDVSEATRNHATITELAYIDDSIADGLFALTLQVAPFQADAAPSRPLLMPLVPV